MVEGRGSAKERISVKAAAREILGAYYVWWKYGEPISKWIFEPPNGAIGFVDRCTRLTGRARIGT